MKDYSDLIYLYNKGCEYNAFSHFGAHPFSKDGRQGVSFAVYAPNAKCVYLTGDFNDWDTTLEMKCDKGIWHLDFNDAKPGQYYKYIILSMDGSKTYKADPYAFSSELRPKTASKITNNLFSYKWSDSAWIKTRSTTDYSQSPINIYEVQLASWDTVIVDEKPINLNKTGEALVAYAKSMHYTHIELMPLTEYPLDESWGYQSTGYYSLSGRYGDPTNLQKFVDMCHSEALGVVLDWVPGHFCPDEHGLIEYDGTNLYGETLHPHWGTYKFNFANKSVWSFLMSSAVFWAKCYHIDGIRVDGVTSMLYLNYGSDDIEDKSLLGSEDDIDAKNFIKKFNDTMHKEFPGFLTFAEESSAYQGVTAPTHLNGLGFDYKWSMGWMNDTLDYFSYSPDDKRQKHDKLTFSSVYMRDEKFLLPLSHDEVVHGKKNILDKMYGDDYKKFALMRSLIAYQIFHPGKKLTFMGIEIAQRMEWRFYEPIEWFMLKYPIHDSFHEYVRKLNKIYIEEPALYEMDNDIYGFEWIDGGNRNQSVYSFIRRAKDGSEIIVVINMSENDYKHFKIGIPSDGIYYEIISSNQKYYNGTGLTNNGEIISEDIKSHGREQSITVDVPALSAMAFKQKIRS